MIYYHYETEFKLEDESVFSSWINKVILSENHTEGEINYIFCDDDYLFDINVKHLNHNTLTDVISFDYSTESDISGDIFISIERVKDNAKHLNTAFDNELKRVMAHGVLHFCGHKDKTKEEDSAMRRLEDEKISMFHVEQTTQLKSILDKEI